MVWTWCCLFQPSTTSKTINKNIDKMNFIKYKGRYVCCHSISTTYKIYSLTKDFLLGQSQKYEAKIFKNFIAMLTMIFKPRYTLMQFYDSRPPVLWSKWPLASSLLQAIKTCHQACLPGYLMHSNKDESLKVWWITIQNWQSY